MQHSKIWIVLFVGGGGLVLAALFLGELGLRPAQAQGLVEYAIILAYESQKVERIENAAGNNVGPSVFEANIYIYEDGSAKGYSQVTLKGSRIEFSYKAGRVIYDEVGQISRVELRGSGEVTGSRGRQPFDFTASVRPEPESPDCVIWDIAGSDVSNAFELHFEAEGRIQVKFSPETVTAAQPSCWCHCTVIAQEVLTHCVDAGFL